MGKSAKSKGILREGSIYLLVGVGTALLELVLFQWLYLSAILPLAWANIVAVIIATATNFLLNRNYAFQIRESRGAALRYAILAFATLFVTTVLFSVIIHGLIGHYTLKIIIKMIIDTVLYFINFRIQRRWVFQNTATEGA